MLSVVYIPAAACCLLLTLIHFWRRYHFQQELLRAQLEIQEQTFRNISQEIHDNIGQVLSLAKLNLATIDVPDNKALEGKILDSKELVGKAIRDLRDLSHNLRTDHITEIGFARAVAGEMDSLRKSGLFETTLVIKGQPETIGPQKEWILFRIVQELLRNIIKHARASHILLLLHYEPGTLRLEVEDNGAGFDLRPPNGEVYAPGGIGLRNMYNRAQLIGAELWLNSTPGAGTKAVLTMPY